MKKLRAVSGALAGVLCAFSVYLALDTFVLSRSYRDASEMNTELFAQTLRESTAAEETAESAAPAKLTGRAHSGRGHSSGKSASSAQNAPETASATERETRTGTESSYRDDNIAVTLSEYRVNDTAVYVADVTLSGAEYLKTALAGDTYGRNITDTTSAMAASHNAVLAVNGDYYGVRETGCVIRNGIAYREAAGSGDILCLYADGSMSVASANAVSAQELVQSGVWQAWSFGPALVKDGAVSVSAADEVGRAMASNPRTAVGMIAPLHYIFVVSDGRTEASEGLSLRELADFMASLGVTTAYNLDGGGSSTMVFQGELVNNPTTNGRTVREREVSDIVYIG